MKLTEAQKNVSSSHSKIINPLCEAVGFEWMDFHRGSSARLIRKELELLSVSEWFCFTLENVTTKATKESEEVTKWKLK